MQRTTTQLADHLVATLPDNGQPVARAAAERALRRYVGPLAPGQVNAVIALAAARGQVTRVKGGAEIARTDGKGERR